MYRSIIQIKKTVSDEALASLRETAEKAFSNRAGSVKNSSAEPHKLVFNGEEKDYGCLDLGVAMLARVKGFLPQIDSWQWIDEEDPGENCDVLKVYAEPVR